MEIIIEKIFDEPYAKQYYDTTIEKALLVDILNNFPNIVVTEWALKSIFGFSNEMCELYSLKKA